MRERLVEERDTSQCRYGSQGKAKQEDCHADGAKVLTISWASDCSPTGVRRLHRVDVAELIHDDYEHADGEAEEE